VDVVRIVQGITFTWDRRKALANRRKHGVSFETACEVFFDPFFRVVAEQEAAGEKRETVRIISARKTTRSERKIYENL